VCGLMLLVSSEGIRLPARVTHVLINVWMPKRVSWFMAAIQKDPLVR
jgi:hypothetical protein